MRLCQAPLAASSPAKGRAHAWLKSRWWPLANWLPLAYLTWNRKYIFLLFTLLTSGINSLWLQPHSHTVLLTSGDLGWDPGRGGLGVKLGKCLPESSGKKGRRPTHCSERHSARMQRRLTCSPKSHLFHLHRGHAAEPSSRDCHSK